MAEELPLRFRCGADWLYGVLHRPPVPRATALLVVVGGPQYRAGSHRQFTRLARHLAQDGSAVLRFDVRGMGDSSGQQRSFEALDDDIQAAIDELLLRCPTVQKVVLWGLCDGASASLLYAGRRADPRLAGLVLLNPWVRTEQGLARTHARHYYHRRLLQAEFWLKLLRGGVRWTAVREWLHNRRLAQTAPASPRVDARSYTQLMADAWRSFVGPRLLILSGDDFVAKEFIDHAAATPEWADCMEHPRLTRVDLAAANHTFSEPADEMAVQNASHQWLLSLSAPPSPATHPAALHKELSTP